jgi:predicted phage terminase large subunit-like protein
MTNKRNKQITDKDELRKLCEEDLYTFACVINPYRVFGDVHKEVFRWLGDPNGSRNKLLLLPRDHQKSFCMATFVAWTIARDPTATFLYLSATATLAEKQLYHIKQMIESPKFKFLWPDMIKEQVGQRERWTNTEFNVDHPLRKERGIRDATITCGGITKTIAGLHPRYIILDDLVVPDNAYTEEGRDQLRALYSQLASIESTIDGYNYVTGTRYFARDLYFDLMNMEEDVFDDSGECVGSRRVYDVFERVVETDGIFLWPRTKGSDGKFYGFDHQILATKKAKYLDKTQFYAQYYNDPNRGDSYTISRDKFQHYDSMWLRNSMGVWKYKDRKLNIFAAIDFAYSLRKRADYTAIVVIGMDCDKNIFVLDVNRFRTTDLNVYFENIIAMQARWGFKKLRAEVNGAQKIIVEYLKDEIRRQGELISIIEDRPNRHQEDKETRIEATLNHLYENGMIWHAPNGVCRELEDELCVQFSTHDDCKDSLAKAIQIAVPPPKNASNLGSIQRTTVIRDPYFGGVIGRMRNVR